MSSTSFPRRSFILGGVRLSAIGAAASTLPPGAFARACLAGDGTSADSSEDDRILVVVQLTGGNDGLNTVIPHAQDAYYRARPTLAQKPSAVHQLDDHIGLHPGLGGLANLYRDGEMAIVHGVGHPNADRSHFRSMEIWHTAEPFKPVGRVGWLGNMADQLLASAPGTLPALSVGGRSSVLSMRGATATPPNVPDDRGFRLARTSQQIAKERAQLISADRDGKGRQKGRQKGQQRDQLAFLRMTARTAYDAAERMSKITRSDADSAYPGTPLGKELRLVGQLIRGGFGTRIYHVSLGGFDTHASQASVHGARMEQLNGALTAFQRDLMDAGQSKKVTTFVFSEFGRRVEENGSRGTDHGRGNPVLLLGGSLQAGQHGTRPDLTDLVQGDIPSTTDFRGLYRQLEANWMGLRPFAAEKVDAPKIV
ncbi:MAG: hypothetical protein ACJA2W_000315 [Planctomycetota bacterium]|jgi:uncharacterized protein (DUF1501 family)